MSETIKFNDREFNFDCNFLSHRLNDSLQTDARLAPVSYNLLQEIVITDSLFDPFIDAKLTIKTKGVGVEAIPLIDFQFYSNNNNGVIFKIQPVDIKNTDQKFLARNTLEFYGIICNHTSYGSDDSLEQLHQFTLQDANEAKLKETKLAAINIPKANGGENIVKNISNITERVIGKSVVSIDEGDSPRFDYTYPNHFNAFDGINFLIPYNINTVNNLPVQNILKYDYVDNKFGSIPVVTSLLNASKEFANIETFLLGEDSSAQLPGLENNATTGGPSPRSVPVNNKINNIAYNNINYNIANNDLLPICVMNTVNSLNVTSMVYIDLQEQINLFNKNIIKQELAVLYGNDVKLNIDLDTHKLKNTKLNYKVINTNLDINTAVNVAKAQLYNSFIFQNMYMVITVPGQPYREPGKFINIKQQNINTGSAADRKLVGQWLVTEVKHVFTGDGKYNNIIQCVKPFINK